jgi:hypothetical protein
MCGSGAVEAGDDCIADHVGCLNGGASGRHLPAREERKEQFDRWSRTFFTFRSAPMTVLWGVEDPVAVVAMAERVKKERPYTDLSNELTIATIFLDIGSIETETETPLPGM